MPRDTPVRKGDFRPLLREIEIPFHTEEPKEGNGWIWIAIAIAFAILLVISNIG